MCLGFVEFVWVLVVGEFVGGFFYLFWVEFGSWCVFFVGGCVFGVLGGIVGCVWCVFD